MITTRMITTWDVTDVADAEVHLVWLMIAAFVALYHLRSRWRGTDVGRWVMSLNVAMLAITSLGLVAIHAGEWVARPWIRTVVWGVVLVVFARQLYLLNREQQDVRRAHREQTRRG